MKEIKLTHNKVALVDDEDFDQLNRQKWHWVSDGRNAERSGYAFGSYGVVMHRLILGLTKDDPDVDHKDGNGLNNQKYNLRLATDTQNSANRNKRKNTSSKYKGVHQKDSNWQACLRINGKLINLGKYPTEEMAAYAYDQAAVKYFGEFALINNVPPIELTRSIIKKKEFCINRHSYAIEGQEFKGKRKWRYCKACCRERAEKKRRADGIKPRKFKINVN